MFHSDFLRLIVHHVLSKSCCPQKRILPSIITISPLHIDHRKCCTLCTTGDRRQFITLCRPTTGHLVSLPTSNNVCTVCVTDVTVVVSYLVAFEPGFT